MAHGGATEGRGEWLDPAGLILLVVVAGVLVLLALLGQPFGLAAWPFAVGAVVGDGLMYLAIRTERFRMPVLVFTIILMVAGLVMLADLAGRYGGSLLQLPWDTPLVVSKLAVGLLCGFGGIVLTGVIWPTVYSPATWDEAVAQRREAVREVLIVGGILGGILLLGLLLFGFSALVVWIAVNFG